MDRRWRKHNDAGLKAYAKGRYDRAEAYFLGALEFLENEGIADERLVLTLENVASVRLVYEDFHQAEILYKRALSVIQIYVSLNDILLVDSLEKLGDLYEMQQHPGRSQPYYRKALELLSVCPNPRAEMIPRLLERLLNPQGRRLEGEEAIHPRWIALQAMAHLREPNQQEFGERLHEFVELCKQAGKLTEATRACRLAQDLFERLNVITVPKALVTINQFARFLVEHGTHGDAEALLSRTLRHHARVLGERSPHVALNMHQLASYYMARKDYARAEPLFWRSLRVLSDATGPEDPNLGFALGALADIHRLKGMLDKAQKLYEQALDMKAEAIGQDNPDFAGTLRGLALVHFQRGQLDMADQYLRRVLQVQERALGPQHFELIATLEGMGRLYATQRRFDAAHQMFNRALSITERTFGPRHPRVAGCLDNLSALLRRMNQDHAAIALEARASVLRETVGA